MLTLIACPGCGAPAEVASRFALDSTNGVADHLALRCTARHHYRMPVDFLPPGSQQDLRDQELRPAGVLHRTGPAAPPHRKEHRT